MKKTLTYSRKKRQIQSKSQKITLIYPEKQSSGKEQRKHIPQEEPLANTAIAVAMQTEDETLPQKSQAPGRKGVQSAQKKLQQRQARALITPQEYMYVKHDLITIAIFTAVIIAGMIVLAFIIGIDM